VVTDALVDQLAQPIRHVVSWIHDLTGDNQIGPDEDVVRSEAACGFTNAAIANFLKAHGNLRSDVDAVLHTYYQHCGLPMSCLGLARALLPLANHGISQRTGNAVMPAARARRVNSLMLTCGLYDGVRNFAFRVGIPAKSGVGGGIIGVVPGCLTVCVWSPELDEAGNSLVGTKALELLVGKTGLSIF